MTTTLTLCAAVILAALAPSAAQAQAVGAPAQSASPSGARLQLDFLDRLASRATETVNISVDEGLLQIASSVLKGDSNDAKVKELISSLKGIYVRVFEFDSDQDFSADVEAVRQQLAAAKQWTRLVNVDSRREREIVEIYNFREGGASGGFAIVVAEPRELVVVNIVGPIDLVKLGALEGQLGIPRLPEVLKLQ